MYFRDTHFILPCVCEKKFKFQAYVVIAGGESLYLVAVFGRKHF